MTNKKSGRKAPVVLAQGQSARRLRGRGRVETSDAQALTAPVPGPLLVLLSRLHREENREENRSATGERDGPSCLYPRAPDL